MLSYLSPFSCLKMPRSLVDEFKFDQALASLNMAMEDGSEATCVEEYNLRFRKIEQAYIFLEEAVQRGSLRPLRRRSAIEDPTIFSPNEIRAALGLAFNDDMKKGYDDGDDDDNFDYNNDEYDDSDDDDDDEEDDDPTTQPLGKLALNTFLVMHSMSGFALAAGLVWCVAVFGLSAFVERFSDTRAAAITMSNSAFILVTWIISFSVANVRQSWGARGMYALVPYAIVETLVVCSPLLLVFLTDTSSPGSYSPWTYYRVDFFWAFLCGMSVLLQTARVKKRLLKDGTVRPLTIDPDQIRSWTRSRSPSIEAVTRTGRRLQRTSTFMRLLQVPIPFPFIIDHPTNRLTY